MMEKLFLSEATITVIFHVERKFFTPVIIDFFLKLYTRYHWRYISYVISYSLQGYRMPLKSYRIVAQSLKFGNKLFRNGQKFNVNVGSIVIDLVWSATCNLFRFNDYIQTTQYQTNKKDE